MDVRGELIDPAIWSMAGESLTRTNISDSDTLFYAKSNSVGQLFERAINTLLESLILAQDERWRRA
jgi:hypothetical protein